MNPCSGDNAKPAECSLDGEEQRASSTCPASSREGDQGVAEPATRALMIDGLSLSKQHSQETEESRGSEILTPAADRDDAPKEEPLATVIVAQDKDGFGKCLLAARAFDPGDTVLQEEPAFVLPNDYQLKAGAGLLSAVCEASGMPPDAEMAIRIAAVLDIWLCASVPERDALHDMFGLPDDGGPMSDFILALIRDMQGIFEPIAQCNVEELGHAVLVWLLSAYTTKDGCAMFTLGHRSNHCCRPNIAYHNMPGKAGRNTLVFRALRTIGKGEPLQVSYLVGYELMAPRNVRQSLLSARKCFECRCSRCQAEYYGAEPARALPCACGGQTRRVSPSKWRCDACKEEAAPTRKCLDEEEALVEKALEGTLRLDALSGGRWGDHWVTGAALWLEGLERLRGGIECGDRARARGALPVVRDYFAWVQSHWPGKGDLYLASAHAAECYACLSAMAEPEATVLASQVCSPYMAALEHEYGAQDKQNVLMRAYFQGYCGHCGKPSRSHCSRCKLVAFCSVGCQKAAWATHKSSCATPRLQTM